MREGRGGREGGSKRERGEGGREGQRGRENNDCCSFVNNKIIIIIQFVMCSPSLKNLMIVTESLTRGTKFVFNTSQVKESVQILITSAQWSLRHTCDHSDMHVTTKGHLAQPSTMLYTTLKHPPIFVYSLLRKKM